MCSPYRIAPLRAMNTGDEMWKKSIKRIRPGYRITGSQGGVGAAALASRVTHDMSGTELLRPGRSSST